MDKKPCKDCGQQFHPKTYREKYCLACNTTAAKRERERRWRRESEARQRERGRNEHL